MAGNYPPEGYVRLHVNIQKELHQKLKIAGAMTSKPMGDLIKQLIRRNLDELLTAGIK